MSDDLSPPLPGEDRSLRTHVEICARRAAQVSRRLRRLEFGQYVALAMLATALGGGAITIRDVLDAVRIAADIAGAPVSPAAAGLAGLR